MHDKVKAASAPASAGTGTRGDVRLDLTGVLADEIGSQHGLTASDWHELEPDLTRVADEIRELRNSARLEVLDLPARGDEDGAVREAADFCRKFQNLVVLGIGGSALGAKAIL
jgi:glucose-6-phosphate isomerase